MSKPQIITSPSGEELVVLPRRDYEDLVDALAAGKVEAALAAGREELLTAQETSALVAAPHRSPSGARSAARRNRNSPPRPACRRISCPASNAAMPRVT